MEELEGLYIMYKPRGMSSFDVIRKMRKKLGIRKMGHAGTLDPLAEGVLIIGVGRGTKKLTNLVGLDKTYEVEIELGIRTDSGDKEGATLEEKEVGESDVERVEVGQVLKSLEGEVELPVPIYSAVKRGGTPLYKRARRGEKIEAPRRIMRIHSLKLLGVRSDSKRVFLTVVMDVASGVYVRSVAEEIGRKLGVPATVSKLIRTRVGEFVLNDTVSLDEI